MPLTISPLLLLLLLPLKVPKQVHLLLRKNIVKYFKESREAQQPKTPEEKLKAEMDSYLSAAVLDSESNPLD